jgi:hypothetical protein
MLASSVLAGAQVTGSGSLLDRIAATSAAYRKSLPDFACDESVVSVAKQRFKRKIQVDFTATIRVARAPDGALSEDWSSTSYMGHPTPGGGHLPLPSYVEGGFGRGVPLFFTAENQRCFIYSTAGDRIAFQSRLGVRGCQEPPSTHGFAQVDSAGELLHGETHRAPQEALALAMTTLTAEDYGSVVLDGKEFRLPVHLYAEVKDGDRERTFTATYSNCRLFKVSATIRPGDTTP